LQETRVEECGAGALLKAEWDCHSWKTGQVGGNVMRREKVDKYWRASMDAGQHSEATR